jgi:hypothetical protein
MDGTLVMLGAGDLDPPAQRERGPWCTGPDHGLGPVSAGDKHHALGSALHHGVAFHPEQPAHFITHGNEQAAVVARLNEELLDHGHDGGERVLAAVFLELIAVHGQRRLGDVGVRLQPGGALPGFPDQAAQSGNLRSIRNGAGVELLVAGQGIPLDHGRSFAAGCCRLDLVPHRTPTCHALSCAC